MIDFVKLRFTGTAKDELEHQVELLQNLPEEALLKHGITSLTHKIDVITGDMWEYPKVMTFQGLEIRITLKQAIISNSIHKMNNIRWRNEDTNYNDFTYSQLCENLDYLIKHIPQVLKGSITSLEFGFNIHPETPAEDIIARNILLHNLKAPSKINTYGSKGMLKQFTHSSYVIKVYDKAKQNIRYRIEYPILRFEIRYSGKELRTLGIQKVQDLKNKMLLRVIFKSFINRYEDLLIVDDRDPKIISKSDYSELQKFTNPLYWEDVKIRQTKRRHKAKFKDLLIKNNLLKMKHRLRVLLIAKFLYLINN